MEGNGEVERLGEGATRQQGQADARCLPPGSGNGGFDSFVQSHCERLVQCLTMIVLDPDLARDAAQEAFLELYLRWDGPERINDPVAWLFRVGINRCKDYRRGAIRAAHVLERLGRAAKEREHPLHWHPETEFVALLKDLPARQRTAAAIFYLADFSVAEIAATMHVSEGSVNQHLFRAREKVRKTLEAT